MKRKIQLIETQVKRAGTIVRFSEELDRDYKSLKGISLLTVIGSGHILASSSVDGLELFPKNFEVNFLQSSDNVSPNQRFFTLEGIPAQGSKIEFDFVDSGKSISYPYDVKIYLLLENK